MADKVIPMNKNVRFFGDGRPDSASVVLAWLRENVGENGQITASLSKMQETTGLKCSTVSRALQRLEAMGCIRLLPRATKTEPNTIQMMENVEAVDWQEMKCRLHEASAGLDIAEGYVVKLQKKIKRLEAEVAELEKKNALLEGEVVKTEELPGGMLMVFIKK